MSQPVGPDYGLEPRLDHTPFLPPLTSRDFLLNEEGYQGGTEFGGVAGMVQPAPHVPNATERLSAIYAIDPMDDGTRPDSVLPPETDGAFNSNY